MRHQSGGQEVGSGQVINVDQPERRVEVGPRDVGVSQILLIPDLHELEGSLVLLVVARGTVLLEDRLNVLGELRGPPDRQRGRQVEDLGEDVAVPFATPLDQFGGERAGGVVARDLDAGLPERRVGFGVAGIGVEVGGHPDGLGVVGVVLENLGELLASLLGQVLRQAPLDQFDPLVKVPPWVTRRPGSGTGLPPIARRA